MYQVENHQANGRREPTGQFARHHVGLVVELFHGLQHALARLVTDVGMPRRILVTVTKETRRSRAISSNLTAMHAP